MDWRVKKFLNAIIDGKWRERAPRGIGADTVSLCIDQGFVTTRRVKRSRKGSLESYTIAFRLTRFGRRALKTYS